MDSTLTLTDVALWTGLLFAFINGFHDAANSVATTVVTRVLTPLQAVAWAAFWNSCAGIVMATGVAATVGSGMVDTKVVTPSVILAGLIGAILWSLITWYLGLPTSSSHALIGGYAGAALSTAASGGGTIALSRVFVSSGWIKLGIYIVVGPFLALLLSYALIGVVYKAFSLTSPSKMDHYFRRFQLVSSAFFSFSHGLNDAQKTIGLLTTLLLVSGRLSRFEIPIWVMVATYAALALGTLSGGWRIINTMGGRLTRLKPRSGVCAETGAGLAILVATIFAAPVSTTQIIAGSISGVGSMQRMKAVRWGLATNIVWAWVGTIPLSAAIGAVVATVFRRVLH